MLSFRNVNITMIVLLLLLAAIDIWVAPVSFWWYVLPAFIYLNILFYGSYFIRAGFYFKSYCKADTPELQIALTFDDGPMESFTPQVLAILKEYGIPATFFCIGKRIQGREQLLQELHRAGHTIGNHSYSHHALFDLFSAGKMQRELEETGDLIKEQVGKRPLLFRPPYGVTNPNLKKAIRKAGYQSIGWSVRSYDTIAKDADQLLEKVSKKVQPGDIFLFHDTMEVTVQLLPMFIKRMKEKGFSFVSVDQLLKIPAYA